MTVGPGISGADERGLWAGRVLGLAIAAMFCAGLLLRKPWLSQTIGLVVLLPVCAWLLTFDRTTRRANARGGRLLAGIVGGAAFYLAVLLLSTTVAGLGGGPGLVKQVWQSVLCVVMVAAFAMASHRDIAFPRLFGRALTVSAAIGAAVMIGVAVARGEAAAMRLQGDPAWHWVLNPNAVAGVYAVCFAVALGHALCADVTRAERAAALTLATLPLAVVLLTQSRGAMLGCGAAVAVAALALRGRALLALGIVAAAGVILALLVFPGWTGTLLARGDSARLAVWSHFLAVGLERPWLGHGLDFDARVQLGNVPIYTPHDIVLAAFVRGGLVGALALSATLLAALAACVGAARRGWWLPLVVLGATLTLCTVDHEMVPGSFGFYWYLYWLPLGLSAAAALAPPRQVSIT